MHSQYTYPRQHPATRALTLLLILTILATMLWALGLAFTKADLLSITLVDSVPCLTVHNQTIIDVTGQAHTYDNNICPHVILFNLDH